MKSENGKSVTVARVLTYFIAAVWVANGLFCKLLDLVPRHREIVGRILGEEHAPLFTTLIGVGEIGVAVWILSGIERRVNAIFQIVLIAAMNVLEFLLVPDLLLFGRANSIIALIFITLIAYREFALSD